MSSVADGFAGLFLFIANWLTPSDGEGELLLSSLDLTDSTLTIECEQKFRWSEDATAIIDAGIPLMVTFYTDVDDISKEQYTRILRSPLDEEFYTVVDSIDEHLFHSQDFSNIYLAVKAFRFVRFSLPHTTEEVEILGVLLPSPVSQMDQTVSLAPICGGDRFYRKVTVTRGE